MAAIEPPESEKPTKAEEWAKDLQRLDKAVGPKSGRATLQMLDTYNKKFGEIETKISSMQVEIDLLNQTLGQDHTSADMRSIIAALQEGKEILEKKFAAFKKEQLIQHVDKVRQYLQGTINALSLIPIIEPLPRGKEIISEIKWIPNFKLRDGANKHLEGFVSRYDDIVKEMKEIKLNIEEALQNPDVVKDLQQMHMYEKQKEKAKAVPGGSAGPSVPKPPSIPKSP